MYLKEFLFKSKEIPIFLCPSSLAVVVADGTVEYTDVSCHGNSTERYGDARTLEKGIDLLLPSLLLPGNDSSDHL